MASIVETETPAHPRLTHAYECSYYPDVDANGTVVGVSCAVFDVTQRGSGHSPGNGSALGDITQGQRSPASVNSSTRRPPSITGIE